MPFTPLPTYVSTGTTGYLATFAVGDTSSPPNFTPVLELKTFKVTPLDVPNVDFTHLLSPNNTRELRPGMIMPGKAELTGNWLGDATQAAIPTNAEAQTVFAFQAIFRVQGTKTCTYTGTAFVNTLSIGPLENDKPVEYSASFQCTGSFTITTA